jgi:hypothetical protein
VITADVTNKKKKQFTLTCEVEPTDKEEVEKILKMDLY